MPAASSGFRASSWKAIYVRPNGIRFSSSQPHVFQLSFWKSLIPPFLRNSNASIGPLAKAWNPATFYIFASLIIGSNSVNMIIMARDFQVSKRQSQARIDTLREVLERLQRGEAVNTREILGTGDPVHEKEWKNGIYKVQPCLSAESDLFCCRSPS